MGDRPGIRDRPEDRQGLVNLDEVLQALNASGITLPTPKTWVLEIDIDLPGDLEFPLFVRTRKSSWKRGGDAAKVRNIRELTDECELLRRAFGWDTTIIARKWLNIASAGRWMFGDAPQEIRTWVVDGEPVAWSFHYLHAVPNPTGFPPLPAELSLLAQMAALAAKPFRSRLIVADFVRDTGGQWHFIEAGSGAAAGTGHEQVFKWVALRLVGQDFGLTGNAVGGQL